MHLIQVQFLTLLVVCFSYAGSTAPRLKSYNVDEDRISVSGFSSGGYFAVQFHVAFSKSIMGVGAVAGGPFWCAQDNLSVAMTACMENPALIVVSELVSITYTTALSLAIDNPINMKNDPVYLFSGTRDSVVVQGVVSKLREYYLKFTSNVEAEFSIPAEHAMVTSDYGSDCQYVGSPLINNCNYSVPYHILNHIYGNIKNSSSSAKAENLLQFDQTEFLGLVSGSMDSIGYVYVPSNCKDTKNQCRLHVAFHGCVQGRTFVGDTYARHAGYNDLAEENDIIVLYPQVTLSKNVPFNPKGCWDWWGYTAPAYATKVGVQMVRVRRMMDRITSG